jgi:tetratricopeptide (TPR) repeat protein
MRNLLLLSAAVSSAALSGAGAQCSPAVQKLITDQKYDEAKTEVQALVKKDAKDDAALHCMGMIYISQDKANDAIPWFEKAIDANPNVSAHHLWLGNAVGDVAQTASKFKQPFMARRVKAEFEKAAALDPASIDARHGLIQFYSMAPGIMGGSMDKAREQAHEIEKLNVMRGHIELATLLEHDKDLAGTEKEYLAAVAAMPDSTAGYNSLGNFYRRQRRFPEAVATYEKLLKNRPDAITAKVNLAWNLALSGTQLDRAEREAKEWLAAPPKDASIGTLSFTHYLLGDIYERQSKKELARPEYQEALRINAKNEAARKALEALK